MATLHDQHLLNGLRAGDTKSVTFLYAECYPHVARYVTKNSGTDQDAEDIFQETIVVLLKKNKATRVYLDRTPQVFFIGDC